MQQQEFAICCLNIMPLKKGKEMYKTYIQNLLAVVAGFAAIGVNPASAGQYGQPTIEINMDVIDSLAKKAVLPAAGGKTYIPLAAPTAAVRSGDAVPLLPAAAPVAPSVPLASAPVMPSEKVENKQEENRQYTGYVEAGAEVHTLTNRYPNWSGEYIKGEVKASDSDNWNGEFINQKRFGDNGVYGAIGNTHTFDENWFTNLSVGAGGSAVFLPKYRVDAFINRKWGDEKRLITTLGFGIYKAMETYNDKNISLGATYYFEEPYIVQAGVRFNRSNPGSADSVSEYVALTQGRSKEHFLTLRYGFGKEAYELQGDNSVINDFYSHEASLNWRQWLGEEWGFNLRGEFYHNPSYIRRGIALGIFREF